jgi:hypothetical protein
VQRWLDWGSNASFVNANNNFGKFGRIFIHKAVEDVKSLAVKSVVGRSKVMFNYQVEDI